MFIDSMECSWVDNPFWRRSLLLKTKEDLARLQASPADFVSIDTARGIGVATVTAAERRRGGDTPPPSIDGAPPVERRRARRTITTPLDRMIDQSKERVAALFQEARLGQVIDLNTVTPLVDDIATTVRRDVAAMFRGTRLKSQNDYTYLHSVAVCALMVDFAIHLGFDDDAVRTIGTAGLLHDIGKVAIPDEILCKPGRLETDETTIMRRHPREGHAILTDSGEMSSVALDVCLHHHERIDGSGYPDGLSGEDISLHARIAAICDVYDAVTSIRPYKRPWSPHEALMQMQQWEGHFDPVLLDAFIANLGIHPLGALVRLHSNRLAIVIGATDDPIRPMVRIFFTVPDAAFITPEDVDTRNDDILRGERGPYWFQDAWPDVLASVQAGRMPCVGAEMTGGLAR